MGLDAFHVNHFQQEMFHVNQGLTNVPRESWAVDGWTCTRLANESILRVSSFDRSAGIL